MLAACAPSPPLPLPLSLPASTSVQVVVPPSGARLILASDGLWDAVPAARLAQALRTAPSPQAAAELAAELALRGQFLGAQDDISGESQGHSPGDGGRGGGPLLVVRRRCWQRSAAAC